MYRSGIYSSMRSSASRRNIIAPVFLCSAGSSRLFFLRYSVGRNNGITFRGGRCCHPVANRTAWVSCVVCYLLRRYSNWTITTVKEKNKASRYSVDWPFMIGWVGGDLVEFPLLLSFSWGISGLLLVSFGGVNSTRCCFLGVTGVTSLWDRSYPCSG